MGGVIHLVDKCPPTSKKHASINLQPTSQNKVTPTFRPQLSSHLISTKISSSSSAGSNRLQKKRPTLRQRGKDQPNRMLVNRGKQNPRKRVQILGKTSKVSSKGGSNSMIKINQLLHNNIQMQERIGDNVESAGGNYAANRRMSNGADEDYDYVDSMVEPDDVDFFDADTRQKWNFCKQRASQKQRKIDNDSGNLGLPTFEHFPIRELQKKNEDKNTKMRLDQECRQLVQQFVAGKMEKGIGSPISNNRKTYAEQLTPGQTGKHDNHLFTIKGLMNMHKNSNQKPGSLPDKTEQRTIQNG